MERLDAARLPIMILEEPVVLENADAVPIVILLLPVVLQNVDYPITILEFPEFVSIASLSSPVKHPRNTLELPVAFLPE